MTARLLHRAGIDLGAEEELVVEPSPDNERGYWEPFPLVEQNDRILAAWGGRWNDPRLDQRPPSARGLPGRLRREMRRLVDQARRRSPVWAWKDPRFSLTWPLWRPRIGRAALLWCLRGPLEVAGSLCDRDDLPIEIGLALWEVYNASIARFAPDQPTLILPYADTVSDPGAALDRMARFLRDGVGVDLPSAADAASCVEAGLRHHAVDDRSTLSDPRLSPSQAALYRALLDGRPSEAATIPLAPALARIEAFHDPRSR